MPSLLEEIQNAAVDPNSDLGTILRKCKVLAARLESKPLEDWLIWESNGYPVEAAIPEYRKWSLNLKGHFSGGFGSGLRNAPVPLACVPETHREFYENYGCRESVVGIQELLKSGRGTFQVETGNLSLVLGFKVYQRMSCIQVWAEMGAGHLVEVLNSVRNRILDFSLALWKEFPNAGEVAAEKPINPSQVTQIFQTTVYDGGSATIVGSADDSPISSIVIRGDLLSLHRTLQKQGISDDDVASLELAVREETPQESSVTLGPKVSAWLGQMALKASEGVLKTGGALGLKLISDALLRYYGINH